MLQGICTEAEAWWYSNNQGDRRCRRGATEEGGKVMWYLTLIGGLGVIMLITFVVFLIYLFDDAPIEGAFVFTFLWFWVLVGILLISIGFFGG
jgi:hypothetical protein